MNPPHLLRASPLFTDSRTAALWLLLRLWLGYNWLTSGIEKFGDPTWVGAESGKAIRTFFAKAIASSQGPDATVTGWYAAVLKAVAQPSAGVLTYLIPVAEVTIGALLLLGLLTGLAALIGALLNLNFLLSGSLGLNPLMLTVSLLIVAAAAVAGWWGVDGWLQRRRLAGAPQPSIRTH
ncbi:DoxX family membrane protein [Deinococcus psychrotolerans]|uniref:DoxX family membrane protein n=1 Tax=Deinococcus psychrotolerans TaxID=2489213 RepID=A0A3G8Y8A7_9DEIO|nr:DoxX family membrane protein [Deinococcus psychrotolerans]AZI41598.1 DoxX family membrane protein [Deinococcus psychrotolerans]